MLSKLFAIAVAIVMIAGVTLAQAAQPQTDVANAAVGYIESLQNPDGGFPAFGTESTPGSTIDAVFALVAADVDPATVTNGGRSPVDYLSSQAATYAQDPGAAAKLALGVSMMGLDPSSFGGLDLWSRLAANVDTSTGAYGQDLFDEALYMLALEASRHTVPMTTIQHLRGAQQPDKGWEFAAGLGSDSNTTALALEALLAVDPQATSVGRGLHYLESVQINDGGFAYASGSESDPNSTALVIQALVAADGQGYPEGIDAGGPWDRGGHTPLDALLSFRNAAAGAFQYAGEDSPFATYQAVPALMLAPFPDLRTRTEVRPTPTATAIATVALTATPQLVLPSAGAGSLPGDRALVWLIAALSFIGVALSVGALRWSRR